MAAGAIVCLVAVAQALPGGVSEALAGARAAGKMRIFDFSLDPTRPFTLWAGIIGGGFLTLATHGTDHYLVQRLLVARSQRDAAIGLTLSGFLVLAQFILFMALGGTNFALMLAIARRGAVTIARPLRNPELRAYGMFLSILIAATALILWVWGAQMHDPLVGVTRDYSNPLRCLRDAAFNVTSLVTTTGYATADFQNWPKAAVVAIMMVVTLLTICFAALIYAYGRGRKTA